MPNPATQDKVTAMATLQQALDINLPYVTVYDQLTQFEHYLRLIDDIKTVRQLDDRHLYWKANISGHVVEGTAEITELVPQRCIAWRSTSGPENAGTVEIRETGRVTTSVILTLHSEPPQSVDFEKSGTEDLAQRFMRYLAKLKESLEVCESETEASRADMHKSSSTMQQNDFQDRLSNAADERTEKGHGKSTTLGVPGNSSVPMPGYAARPDVLDIDESQPSPVLSDARIASTLETGAPELSQAPAKAALDTPEGSDSA